MSEVRIGALKKVYNCTSEVFFLNKKKCVSRVIYARKARTTISSEPYYRHLCPCPHRAARVYRARMEAPSPPRDTTRAHKGS